MNPHELNSATVSMPVAPTVEMTRVSPDVEAPIAREFFPMPGVFIVHVERSIPPSFPMSFIYRDEN